jgi:PAS domain S-box-containing protein
MVVVDHAGEIVLLNLQAEKQFGYQRDELICQPVTNIIPKGFAERLIADDLRSAADALAQQIGTGIELVGLRKDGTEFPIEIMLSPLESTEGILVTAAIRNISKRKETEGQLLQSQKLESIGRLAGGIAHDFNNMLFVIHGYAELLAEDLAAANRVRLNPDDALLSVTAITRAADSAARLTAQLLAFSRQQVIKPRVLDINAAIGDLEPMVRQLIGENMRLVVRLDRDAGCIRTDPGQFDQVLVNLVVNARDAMPDGGTVTIETKSVVVDEPYAISHFDVRPGPYLLLSVTDTGIGMDRATREHVFDPFFTTKQPGKGTGLGLATTYGIVRQAGGSIWVYSELGIGSSFKLYFPRVDASVSTRLPGPAAVPAIGAGTILVVEDERGVREMTTLLLTRSGYSVVAVADGAEAMLRLEQLEDPIDVLITDVIMPAMSGLQLAEWTMDRYPRIGVVLLSGYTAETLDLERVTARGAAFVPKPVASGQLLIAVQHARAMREGELPALPAGHS